MFVMPTTPATKAWTRLGSGVRREGAALNTIRKLYDLLSPRERLQAYGVLAAIVVMALLQVAGIASITPFLALVSNPAAIDDHELLRWAYHTFDFDTEVGFLLFVGFGVLVVFTLSNLFAMFTTWLSMRFSWERNYTLSRRLLEHYFAMPYTFFLNRTSADLSKNVLDEVREIVGNLLVPGMRVLARGAAAVAIVVLLIMVDPMLAVLSALMLGGVYAGIYLLVRERLARIGQERLEANLRQFQAASEGLAGIKDIKLLGKEGVFLRRYAKAARRYARSRAMHETIEKVPHYLIETVAFGGMLLIIMYLLVVQGSVAQVVPTVGLYAFASYRLLPAIKEIFSGVTKVRFNLAALEAIHADLQYRGAVAAAKVREAKPLACRRAIELESVTFSYPGSDRPVLENFSLKIAAHTSVAFVGATGSGKTTIVDLILGLLEPSAGRLLVDGTPIDAANQRSWQNNLGYVPQHIYLLDDTIAHNIAFGVPPRKVDKQAVIRAAKIANLHDFVTSELPKGYATRVGERGIRLSGGQRQRVGIARALYHNPDVLILDEATSALDTVTEKGVFEAVENVAKTKTVIMVAHRLSTIRHCDTIYLVDQGRIVARGRYGELMERSPQFRAMAADEPGPTPTLEASSRA
jgi:ABC-type multidrug transport system fused ATPase/permease subunit